MTTRENDFDRLQHIGYNAATVLRRMVENLEKANGSDAYDQALDRIREDPLSVQVRSDWHDVGKSSDPSEFEILLSTGGPATRIVGTLNEHCEPISARLEVQDWFTQWTEYTGDAITEEDLLTYCRCFYYGD